jgi:hypothetical protein
VKSGWGSTLNKMRIGSTTGSQLAKVHEKHSLKKSLTEILNESLRFRENKHWFRKMKLCI